MALLGLSDIEIRKIEAVTEGLHKYIYRELTEEVSTENAITIANFILAQKTEINLADTYRKTFINVLTVLSKFLKNKLFKHVTREDILLYLDSLRKPEASDPLHKWVGTYNVRRQQFMKFFKWLYYPNVKSDQRPIPAPMHDIPTLKRKEQSIYKPTDLWSSEDDIIFLKFCPNKRDRCYHTISRDLSCRPHEILKLRIKDVVFKTSGDYQYAEVLINGKTGSRHIPLFNSIPYLKDWLDYGHPQRGNPTSFLIPSLNHAALGKKMSSISINKIYQNYRRNIFPKLLDDPNVSPEDKRKIRDLLNKPWNPYIRRHSALTEKSKILKEHVLRQHAGWSSSSQMPQKYLHYYGNESSESLLEAYGIVTKDQQLADALKPKQCPNCNEPNKPDSRFCAKCRMVLTYDAYNETLEKQQKKDTELHDFKERISKMENILVAIQPLLQQVKPEMISKLEVVEREK